MVMSTTEIRMFRAHANGGFACSMDTPQQAAIKFFETFPTKRKCDVIEGWVDQVGFFTVRFGKPWPKSWKAITKKTACNLPDNNTGE